MSERRKVWHTLSELLARVEEKLSVAPDANGLGREIRKLGKAQYKANMLAEKQASQWEQAIAATQEAYAQQVQLFQERADERAQAAQHELLEALIPVLDGLENAIASGNAYLEKRDRASRSRGLSPAQAALVSPMDREKLAAWLDGLRLVRERLLAVLEAGGVVPIPTVGQPFDPYLHVAVATTSEGDHAPGTIVAEERRGYRSPTGVLRFADVVVYRKQEGQT